MRSIQSLTFIVVATGLVACTALLGNYDVGVLPSGAVPEGGGPDSASDANKPGDSGPLDGSQTDGDAANVTYTYNDVTDHNRWSSSIISTARMNRAGGAFDGRYVYTVPSNGSNTASGVVDRYDTKAGWADSSGWKTFDMTQTMGAAKGYYGAVFDGRYMYFSPYHNGVNVHGLIARYDTRAPFELSTSWSFLDIASKAAGFGGAAFDGKYVYFLPSLLSGRTIARYDTTASFTFASVETFDTTALNQLAYSFDGGTIDGKYLYLTPYKGSPCIAVRYELGRPFASPSSWQHYDVSKYGCGLRGATFDGKYVYYAGNYDNGNSGKIVRFDTSTDFTGGGGFASFDLTQINPQLVSFAGIVFDGRRLYAVPQGTAGSVVGIYDTTLPFEDVTSWKTFDTATVSGSPRQFTGGVFDGQYLYLVPSTSGYAVRFDAKSPPGLPPLSGRSFY